jgi:regulator of protease activity HflC (stomatin/prohibitin superfamily)
MIVPFVDVLHRVSLRIVTMPIQSQGTDFTASTTRKYATADTSALTLSCVMMVAIENVYSAIDQIAQTTLRKVVGQHSLDHTLSETDKINLDICKILDVSTVEWGVEVTLVELKDIQLPARMKRAMARQAEAERESQVEIGADKNTTVVFPAPLMTTIAELGTFLARETAAAGPPAISAAIGPPVRGRLRQRGRRRR